jgi:hypothetical protein
MEHHHILGFLFVSGLKTFFLICGLGVEEKKGLPPRRPDLVLCLFFLWVLTDQVVSRLNPRTLVSPSNPRILNELERKIRDTLPVFLVTF